MRVVGGLRGARDQQGHRAGSGHWPEHRLRPRRKAGFAGEKGRGSRPGLCVFARKGCERIAHCAQCWHDPPFKAAKRGEAERHERALQVPQIAVPLVARMPDLPSPWLPTDWLALTRNQTRLVFDATRAGEFLPLLWWDDRHHNFPQTTFGVASYVGGASGADAGHEAITGMALVLSGFLTGANMSCLSGPGFACVDFERMLLNYFDVDHGAFVWKDNSDASADGELWYQAWMSMLPLMVAHASRSSTLEPWVRNASLSWLGVERQLGGSDNALPDYNCTGVHFSPDGRNASCFRNGVFVEPVASAGFAFLHFATRAMVGEDTADGAALLQGAKWGMDYLIQVAKIYDPFWEVSPKA